MGKLFPKLLKKIMNIYIFCSPEEAMLDNWQKLDFNTKYFLFFEKYLNLVQLKHVIKQKEKHPSLYMQGAWSRKCKTLAKMGKK